MLRVYFLDLDGVVVEQGTHTLRGDSVLPALRDLAARGQIWLFSSWAFTPEDINFLTSLNIPFAGIIRKPVADEYVYIDDRLLVNLCGGSLND